MGSIWTKEPIVIVGAVISATTAIIATLLGQGFISDSLAGHATDVVTALGQAAIALTPLITAVLSRPRTTPIAAPTVPAGTVVKVEGTDRSIVVGA